MVRISRRELFGAAAGLGASILIGCSGKKQSGGARAQVRSPKFDAASLAVASGDDPAKNTRAAVEALGGMSKLVRKGDSVVIKPNIAWNRPPDMAATTNPEVVAEIVRMCKEAGAGNVLVIDHIIDKPAEGVLGLSGIKAAAEKAGASVEAAQNESDYRSVEIPKGKLITSDTCIKEILSADVFINVPIAKSHSATKLTLGMKNLMGCIYDRQNWHETGLDQCIADYASAIRPDLTILDANKVLVSNGPKGPGETKLLKKVAAGVDPVAVDAFGATLFGIDPVEIGYIKLAAGMGVGEMDLKKVQVRTV